MDIKCVRIAIKCTDYYFSQANQSIIYLQEKSELNFMENVNDTQE